MADLGFGKGGGGFLKSGPFQVVRAFSLGGKGVSGGAPLAPPAGSGAEPQLEARGSGERFELSQPPTHFGEF